MPEEDEVGAEVAEPAGSAGSDAPRSARERALRRIPPTHALALRLRDTGLAPDLIARRLAIEPESIGPLLSVAEAKLAAAVDDESS